MKQFDRQEYKESFSSLNSKERKQLWRNAAAWRDADVRSAKRNRVPPTEAYAWRLMNGEQRNEIKSVATKQKEPAKQDRFRCSNCNEWVAEGGAGSRHRNHCPWCLHSLHLDDGPGDRSADCGGIMEPIAVWVRKDGEWALVHRCTRCGALGSNRIAADDNLPLLLSLAARPMARPPLPLDRRQT